MRRAPFSKAGHRCGGSPLQDEKAGDAVGPPFFVDRAKKDRRNVDGDPGTGAAVCRESNVGCGPPQLSQIHSA
jgi:hypothetical protein